jgi:DNA-directed RNA polymerase II subunit RPB3|eukprot:Tamp_08272.p1 GENE.Tamp_08272~~Tamp_08272.p1  ORF type:complete len:310 (-),score=28.72 Tamp_08272:587-1516(-)
MLTKIEALTKFETKIVIDNFSCSLANSLRRIMIGEIPTISIDLVSVEINSSLICDEFLSHRLGLIPLKSGGARKMKLTRECECDDYCPNCSSLFTLNIKAKNPETGVYSTHLCNLNAKEDLLGNLVIPIHDSGSNSKFSYSPILIAKLKLGQQIKLLGVAKKGIGLDHSKWSPVSVIKLKTEPIFYIEMENLNLSLNHKQKKTLCQIGNGLFEFDFEKKRVEIIRKKKTNSDFFLHKNIKFMADFFKNQEISTKNILKLEKNFSKIIFEIETTGVLEAEEIFKNSVMILKRKLNILGINIEKISKNDLI